MRYPTAAVLLIAIGLRPAEAKGAEDQILTLLKSNCDACHGDSKTSGFSVNTLESVIAGGIVADRRVPDNPEKSPLIQLLQGRITPKMPLGKAFPTLKSR